MSKKIVVLSIVCVVLLFGAFVMAAETGAPAAGQTTTTVKSDVATTATDTTTTATEVKPAAEQAK